MSKENKKIFYPKDNKLYFNNKKNIKKNVNILN